MRAAADEDAVMSHQHVLSSLGHRAAVVACALGMAVGNTHPAAAAGEAERPLTLRSGSAEALAGLQLAVTNRGRGSQRRLAVTDVIVRLRAGDEGRLATMLALPDGDRQGRGRVLFTAELLVVAGGRLVIEERAQCGPWQAGTSLCRTECDGGTFAILRQHANDSARLMLHIGEIDVAEDAGVQLGACRGGDFEDVSLVPRTTRVGVTLPLSGE